MADFKLDNSDSSNLNGHRFELKTPKTYYQAVTLRICHELFYPV